MESTVFFVEVMVDPAQRERFDEMMADHAAGTLADEAGCLAFDVYVDRTDPNRYALYERYADQAALDTHRFSARLAAHHEEIDPLIVERRIWPLGDEVDVSNFPGQEASSR
jgi:quinol monooxygenase YgiN